MSGFNWTADTTNTEPLSVVISKAISSIEQQSREYRPSPHVEFRMINGRWRYCLVSA